MYLFLLLYSCTACFVSGWLFCSIRRDRQESADFWFRIEQDEQKQEERIELMNAARTQYREDIHTLLILTGEGLHPGKGKRVASTISEICSRYGMDENVYLHCRKV